MANPTREDFLPAAKRFNRWQFIEAQTVWTELSEKCDAEDKTFCMAMANIAGGFSKIWHKGGEPHAMVSLLTAGVTDLQTFLPRYLGIELENFVKALNNCLEEAKRWRRGDTAIFNRDLIPRIDFTKKADV